MYIRRHPAEIDVLIVDNGTLYPTEIKKSARLDKNDVKQFSKLETFRMPIGTGGLLSLLPRGHPCQRACRDHPRAVHLNGANHVTLSWTAAPGGCRRR